METLMSFLQFLAVITAMFGLVAVVVGVVMSLKVWLFPTKIERLEARKPQQPKPETYAATKNVRIDYRTAHGKVWRDR